MKKIIISGFFIVALMASSLVYAVENPTVKVISPTAYNTETGEIEVLWSSKNLPSEAKLSFIVTHKLFSINTIQTKNDGKEVISLPFPGRYDIQIVNNGVKKDPLVYDKFSLYARLPNNDVSCGNEWRPSVRVLSPNGGQAFVEGQEVEVTWSTCNLLPSTFMAVDIVGYNLNGTTFTKYMKMVPNTGSTTITLPDFADMPVTIKEGDIFRIKVRDISNGEKTRDYSDDTFTVTKE